MSKKKTYFIPGFDNESKFDVSKLDVITDMYKDSLAEAIKSSMEKILAESLVSEGIPKRKMPPRKKTQFEHAMGDWFP